MDGADQSGAEETRLDRRTAEPLCVASMPQRIDWAAQLIRLVHQQHLSGRSGVDGTDQHWRVDADNALLIPRSAFQLTTTSESMSRDWQIVRLWITHWYHGETFQDPCLRFAWNCVFRALEYQQKNVGSGTHVRSTESKPIDSTSIAPVQKECTQRIVPENTAKIRSQYKRVYRFSIAVIAVGIITATTIYFASSPFRSPDSTLAHQKHRGHTTTQSSDLPSNQNAESIARGHTTTKQFMRGHSTTKHAELASIEPPSSFDGGTKPPTSLAANKNLSRGHSTTRGHSTGEGSEMELAAKEASSVGAGDQVRTELNAISDSLPLTVSQPTVLPVPDSSPPSAPEATNTATPSLPVSTDSSDTSTKPNPDTPETLIASLPSRQSTDPVNIATIHTAHFLSPRIELPFRKSIELVPTANKNIWNVLDPATDVSVAEITHSDRIIQWTWLPEASRHPASEQFYNARLIWRSENGPTHRFLKQPIHVPKWTPQWEKGSISESFDLTQTPARSTLTKIDFTLPPGIEFTAAQSNTENMRRGKFACTFHSANETEIMVRVELEWNGSRTWQLQHAATLQLYPDAAWISGDTTKLDQHSENLEQQRLHAQQTISQLRQAYNLLLEPHRSQSRIQRAKVELALKHFEQISERLTKARKLLHQLQHETHWQVSLETPWESLAPDTPPLQQKILQLGDLQSAQSPAEDSSKEIPADIKAQEKK